MTDPVLHIRASEVPRVIEVIRGEEVPDSFWLVVRAEWGSDGRLPARSILVPVERFLSQLSWLSPACRRYGIGVDWDRRSRQLVVSANNERRTLSEVLGRPDAFTVDVDARLATGRFKRPLHAFQSRDLAHLLELPHGANFSVPGAGKTTVAYATYEAERLGGRVSQILVVAPLSAFSAWMEEAELCFDPVPVVACYDGGVVYREAEVLLVNYHRLAASYETIARWVLSKPTLVILDEAHRMKRGWSGQWGSACLGMAYLATRRDILTGTPAPQALTDLEALLEFVWPGQSRRILPPHVLGDGGSPPAAAHRVANLIRPLFVRTTKQELGLLPPSYRVVEIPLTGLHSDIYRALLDQYVGQFDLGRRDRVTFAQMGEVVMYLLEAATNPALLVAGSSRWDPIEFRHPPLEVPPDSRLADLLANYGRYETPRKFVELARIVEVNARNGRKTLVWSNFVRNLETLRRMLQRYRPAMIHGGIPSDITQPAGLVTREAELMRFRRDPQCMVLLANPAATGEGVSLHDVCHDAVYLDRTFNAGLYLQSVDRIHRLGLAPDQETRIIFLLTSSTVDEVVDRRVRDKAERLGSMLDDPDIITMALPDEEDYGPAIDTEEDLAALFAHLRGDDVA